MFRRQGHQEPRSFATPSRLGIRAAPIHRGLATYAETGDDFIAIAGTLFYRGEAGENALRAFLADYVPPFKHWPDVLGHFAALIYKAGKLHILTDWTGHFHLYRSRDQGLFSTSFLAAAATLDKLVINKQALYEFVFASAPLGNDTVFAEISRLPRSEELEIGPSGEITIHKSPRSFPVVKTGESIDALVERIAGELRNAFEVPVRHYGDNIQCPLSGGFDSRLVLALLRDRGAKPHVYVYGKASDADVQIATKIAQGEHFDLEIFDKSAFGRIEPDAFAEIVERNFFEMDATAMDGGLFDGGGNSYARHQRAKGGALAVSGGAGEIFRNYFYLRDHPMRTRAVIDAFYAAFDPEECTPEFRESEYLHTLDLKLREALGVGGEAIDRLDLERAYSMFRCPSTFGREISMVGRFGPYFVPFCEYAVTRAAANIPLALRTHGVFQSALLEMIDARLAAYPSAYGHSFTERPGFKHRLSDAISLYRPPWLRRYNYRMKKRLGAGVEPFSDYLSPRFLSEAIDIGFPIMRRYFRIENVTDAKHYGAIATLEYLMTRFSDRLSM